MMGSQKVPGMVVLHCNSRIYGNSTFKVRPLCTHKLIPSSCHCWKHQWKDSFGFFWSLTVVFILMSSMVLKYVPLRPIFRVGNSQKSLGVRSGEGTNVFLGEELLHNKRCMAQCVTMMHKPLFLPTVTPRTPQNLYA
jgi:hypothetical protein